MCTYTEQLENLKDVRVYGTAGKSQEVYHDAIDRLIGGACCSQLSSGSVVLSKEYRMLQSTLFG